MPKPALLFDIDGTLIDSNDLHVAAWRDVFAEAGFDLDRDAVHGQVGKGGDNLVPALLPDIDPDRQEAIASRHGEVYKTRYIERARPFPGARDLLARARADGFTVALASSAHGDEIDHYLDLLDAHALIDLTTSKDDVAHSKPAPDIFHAALEKAGATGRQALVIGDTPYDVIAAARNGIATVALLSGGFAAADLRAAGSAALFRETADLLDRYEESPIAALRDGKDSGGGGW